MKRSMPIIAALCALLALITASPSVLQSASRGLRLCGELIVPSLFPFFVVSSLLARLGLPRVLGGWLDPPAKKLGVSGAGTTALLIGLTGGYPMGAAYLAELTERGQLPERETEKLLGFCNNSGPAFLAGAIGAGVFASPRVGLLLYAAHALAALLAALLLRSDGECAPAAESPPAPPVPRFSRALSEAVQASVPAVLNVCGFVILFTVFTGLLEANGFLSAAEAALSSLTRLSATQCRALLLGFWELGGGIGAMRGLPADPVNLALAALLTGWGGVSVHFQSLSPFASLSLSCSRHLLGRILSAVLGAGLAYLLALLFL